MTLGTLRRHRPDVDVEDASFGSALHPIDDDRVFQQFLLLVGLENRLQDRRAKWPVDIVAYAQRQMDDMLSVDDAHLLRLRTLCHALTRINAGTGHRKL